MHEGELWQDLLPNGEPVPEPRQRGQELPIGHVCASAHVWLWRSVSGRKEVLLQRRSASKKTWPGYYDISAAGHINFGETPLEAAQREAKEEVNLDIVADALKLIGVYRLYGKKWRDQRFIDELQWVYIYKLENDQSISFADGEVEAVRWTSLDELWQMGEDEESLLVKHTPEYLRLVISAIERQ